MEPTRNLNSFPEIKSLSDERRLTILRHLMRAPLTLSQLGEKLGMSAARIRHHLKILEERQLVELVGTRPAGGFTEKYYRATAGAFFVNRVVLPQSAAAGTIFVIGSHDPAIDMLAADTGSGTSRPDIRTVPVGSLDGLIALRQGLGGIAGCHLYQPADNNYNTSYVRHLFPGRRMVIVTLAHRLQGLVTAPGNPHAITNLEGLAREGITFINRCEGSGTRLWLDHQLDQSGIEAGRIRGYERAVNTHADVARAVLSGEADNGLAVLAAAASLGLGFIPLFEERFDLVLDETALSNPLVAWFFDLLCSARIRDQIGALPGYRTSETGNRILVA